MDRETYISSSVKYSLFFFFVVVCRLELCIVDCCWQVLTKMQNLTQAWSL